MDSYPLQNNRVQVYKKRKSNTNDKIDLEKYFFLFLRNWYLFVVGLIFALSLGYLYNKAVLPTYKVYSVLSINQDQGRSSVGLENLMNGFSLNSGVESIENQIKILTSWSLINKAIDELPFDIEYYYKGRVNKAILYPVSPFYINIDSSLAVPYDIDFSVSLIDANKFKIISEDDLNALNKQAEFGDTLEYKDFRFNIEKEENYRNSHMYSIAYYFKFYRNDKIVRNFKNRLKVTSLIPHGNIVELRIEGTNWRKDKDFLTKLIDVFNKENLYKKNFEADRTIDFINHQIENISDSLLIAEDRLQEFRSRNKVMDISAQGTQVMEQAIYLEDERARLMLEKDYFAYLNKYLSNEELSDQVMAPSTMGITDPSVSRLVTQLSELQTQYFSLGASEKNPLRVNLGVRIQNTKNALLETLKGMIRNNEYALTENQSRLRELNRQATTLPETERKLLGIEREFKLNDALYNYLLQKRSEAQIQKASNTPDTDIIDPPRVAFTPVWPKTQLIYLLGIIFGLLLPAVGLIIIDLFQNKINSEEDLKNITDLPITGHISLSKKSYSTVVLKDPESITAETFRSLRIRLGFFTKEISSPVILISSSIPGEGKTFSAINLASAYSLEEKKTVLVGFDLRRPKIYEDFDIHNEVGVSSYLIGHSDVDGVIQRTKYPYLDVITSGPIPPNPAELTATTRTQQLIEELKKRYKYIIIDSSPIGTVSDTYYLTKFSDANLLVVRIKKSLKKHLETTISSLFETNIKELSIILNGLSEKKGYYRYSSKK